MQLVFTHLSLLQLDDRRKNCLKMPCINYSWEFFCCTLLSTRPPTNWQNWSLPENHSTVFQERGFFESVNHHSWLDVWYSLWQRCYGKLLYDRHLNLERKQSSIKVNHKVTFGCRKHALVGFSCENSCSACTLLNPWQKTATHYSSLEFSKRPTSNHLSQLLLNLDFIRC